MHSDRIAMTARTKRGRASGQRQEPQEAGEASGTRAISSSSSARQGIRQSARQRTAATPVSTRSATKIESSQPEDRSGISQSNDGDSDDDDFQPTTVNGNIAVVVDRSYKTPSKKRNAETSISTPRKGKQARTKDSSGENCVDSSKDEDMEEIIKAEAVVAAPPHISEQESDAESTTSIKYGMGDDDNYFDDEDEDDEGDWEEVLPSAPNEADEEEEEEELSGPWMYNPVEIVFDKPIVETKKTANRGISKEVRMIRVLIHQTHLLCLIANGLHRNRWICHPKLQSVALSIIPDHIADSIQTTHTNPTRELNALHVLALWWRDSFVVTGTGICHQDYTEPIMLGSEPVFVTDNAEVFKKRKNLQRRLLNRRGPSDICSQLFTAICRSLGLRARLIESLQACPFKMTLPKENAEDQPSAGPEGSAGASSSKSGSKGKKKKVVEELDEDDTTRGSRRIVPTPHRLLKKPSAKVHQHQKQADPPVFWSEVYSDLSDKWICIDPVRGVVNSPLKLHPSSSCTTNKLAYVVAYDEDNYVTDVTRRYTSHWGSVTKKLRVQPAGPSRFDWWEQTMGIIKNPHVSPEAEREEAELLRLEISEQMPTKLGDFNNHPLYALERHLKKFEVLYPKGPVLGHIRSEAIYPRSSVKQIKSKETWLKQARQIKSDETIPVKWVKSRPATLFQLRLRQQGTLSGSTDRDKSCLDSEVNDGEKKGVTNSESTEDQIPLFGEWQTEPYQPPWVVDGRVPRNQYGRLDVFTPAMVPVGGTHLKGRGIGRVARLLGVDFVEAVTGFEFQSRKSVPVVQGIVVPTECADLVMDAYHEMAYHADVEAQKKRRIELLRLWRKFIKGTMVRSRLLEEYGQNEPDDDKWEPVIEDEEEEKEGRVDGVQHHRNQDPSQGPSSSVAMESSAGSEQDTKASANFDRGGGFMLD